MSFSENEMRGLLTGKCIPGDMKVNEELPVYLVRKFDALQEQVQQLAAESAGLKDFAWAEAVSYDMEKQDRWMMECNGSRDRYRALETRATDAVIRDDWR